MFPVEDCVQSPLQISMHCQQQCFHIREPHSCLLYYFLALWTSLQQQKKKAKEVGHGGSLLNFDSLGMYMFSINVLLALMLFFVFMDMLLLPVNQSLTRSCTLA